MIDSTKNKKHSLYYTTNDKYCKSKVIYFIHLSRKFNLVLLSTKLEGKESLPTQSNTVV